MPASPRALAARARLYRDLRRFFQRRRFLEIDAPIRVRAPAPEPYIDAIPLAGAAGYLRTSPELHMKRLLAEGHERIFTLGAVFRAGERGDRHAEEFAMVEWYRARADHRALMEDCEALLRAVAHRRVLRVGKARVALTAPFDRRSAVDLMAAVGVDAHTATDEVWSETMGLSVEPTLGLERPAFVVDYPVSQGALAARRADAPRLVERFELYVAGVELANGWTELVDPVEQRERFERDRNRRAAQGKDPYPLDERFLAALGRCPPCAGVALGVDRLLMLLTGAKRIEQVRTFAEDD